MDEKRLMEHLKKVAKQGYAIDSEEFEEGVKCVAAPVRDYTGQVIAGLSVSGPTMRMDQKKISETVIPAVLHAGEQLSRRLGHNLGEE